MTSQSFQSTDLLPLFDNLTWREVGSYAETFISKFDNEGLYYFSNSYTLDTLKDKHLDYIQTVFCHLHSNFTNISCPKFMKHVWVLHYMWNVSCFRSNHNVALAYWDRTIFGAPYTSIMNQFDINSSLLAIKIHHYPLVTFSGGADISMMPGPSLLGVAN